MGVLFMDGVPCQDTVLAVVDGLALHALNRTVRQHVRTTENVLRLELANAMMIGLALTAKRHTAKRTVVCMDCAQCLQESNPHGHLVIATLVGQGHRVTVQYVWGVLVAAKDTETVLCQVHVLATKDGKELYVIALSVQKIARDMVYATLLRCVSALLDGVEKTAQSQCALASVHFMGNVC